MKLRKIIAIILMTLANVFMLAHALMPHHHHDGVVVVSAQESCCTVVHHCAAATADCCNSAQENQHQQSGQDGCNLPQLVERDGRSINDGFSAFQIKNDVIDACLCILCYACNQQVVEQDEATLGKYKRYTEYTGNYTSPYVGATFGFRAPPTISLL